MKPLMITAFLDGSPGHEKQTRGILGALEKLTRIEIQYRKLSAWSSWSLIKQWAATSLGRPGRLPEPGHSQSVDLIIGTGSKTHLPMLHLKQKTSTPVVTCMTPNAIFRSKIDLCLIPQHDRPTPGQNVFCTMGPPNLSRNTGEHDSNRGLILIGGRDEKSHTWSTQRVLAQVAGVLDLESTIHWTISSSPRTPLNTILELELLSAKTGRIDFFRAENTPAGWIEQAYEQNRWAWVTADSISMIYEALSAGCRVGILPVKWKKKTNKFQDSIDTLIQEGYVTTYDSRQALNRDLPAPAVLDESTRCAREILNRWWPQRLAR